MSEVKYIDATNLEIVEDLIGKTNKTYSINDCVMVRTTDVFPFDGIVQTPINGNAYEFNNSIYFNEIVIKMLQNKYPNYFIDEKVSEEYSKELKEYSVVFETLRRTTHFTINGLVGSTAYGNFDNRPYVILEPLKYHIDKSMKALRVEDTYFDSDLSLSDESALVIDENTYNKISNDPNYTDDLSKFKVYVYKGNQQNAVSLALNDMGYDSFLVSSHGYVNGIEEDSMAFEMYNFINAFANKHNIPQEKHFYSNINYEDALARNEKSAEINKMHLMYILDNSIVSSELSDKIKLSIEYNRDISDLLEQVINQIGFEHLKKLTKEFNTIYIESLNKGKNHKKI
ncbi:MAG: hypothetical protein E7166_04300 [Firmicutes bacterium]|nr:hypothetical protein [Bacillota bacterium]